MHLMQCEMQSFKTILEPWYNSEVQGANHPDICCLHVPDDSNLQGFTGPSLLRTAVQHTQVLASLDPFDAIDAKQNSTMSFFLPHSCTSGGLLDI